MVCLITLAVLAIGLYWIHRSRREDRSEIRARGFSKPAKTAILCLALVFALIAHFIWGIRSPDPRYTMQNLGGLTPDQVIARLGPPPFPGDPRQGDREDPKQKPWTPELEGELGPLQFYYHDNGKTAVWIPPHNGHEYGIIFKNGHVAEVLVGSK